MSDASASVNVMQLLLDAGVNAFAAQMLVESYAQRRNDQGVRVPVDPPPPPIAFELEGVVVWLAPAARVPEAPPLPRGPGYEYPHLPAALREGLRRYADERLRPGGLLTAVLENDLARAVAVLHRSLGADALRDLVTYVHMELPAGAHGSHEKVEAWLGEGA